MNPLIEFAYNNIEVEDTLEEWAEKVKEWEFRPIMLKGVLAAVVAVKDNEVHLSAAPEFRGRWLSRRVLKEIFSDILEEYGSVKTCVSFGDDIAGKFVERLGFEPDLTVYTMTKLAHVKE